METRSMARKRNGEVSIIEKRQYGSKGTEGKRKKARSGGLANDDKPDSNRKHHAITNLQEPLFTQMAKSPSKPEENTTNKYNGEEITDPSDKENTERGKKHHAERKPAECHTGIDTRRFISTWDDEGWDEQLDDSSRWTGIRTCSRKLSERLVLSKGEAEVNDIKRLKNIDAFLRRITGGQGGTSGNTGGEGGTGDNTGGQG